MEDENKDHGFDQHLADNEANNLDQQEDEQEESDDEDNLALDSFDKDEESFDPEKDLSVSEENENNYLYFLQAVKDGNLRFLDELIEKNVMLNFYIERKDQEGILPLQYAVLFGNNEMIDKLLELGAEIKILLEGVPLLHLSLTFTMYSSEYRVKAINCFKHLSAISDQNLYCDRLGRSILHYIINNDLHECLEDKQYEEKLYYVKDFNGDTPIDYLYIYNSLNCFKFFLNQFGSKIFADLRENSIDFIEKCLVYNCLEILKSLNIFFIYNDVEFPKLVSEYKTIIDKYEEGTEISNFLKCLIGADHDDKATLKTYFLENYENLMKENTRKSEDYKTIIIYHQTCGTHGFIPETTKNRVHKRSSLVENPDRLSVLLQPPFGVFLSDFFRKNCIFKNDSLPATLADISKVHDYDYINSIRQICLSLKSSQNNNIEKYDSDTYINQSSFDASLQAAGCVLDAVDQVILGKHLNAFVAIRPPGHHAGYFGKVESEFLNCPSSNGFCFFNNVIVAAAYCKYKYRERIKKIAIIDFDVHHGNGSEELIRNLIGEEYKTQHNSKLGDMTFKKKICTPWNDFDDSDNVLFVSLHGFNKDDPRHFYPSSGSTQRNSNKEESIYPGGVLNIPIFGEMKYSYGYRNVFRSKVVNRLVKFKPDIIFISAGFDGHENETINDSYMQLNEFDYKWMTEEIMKVSKKFCDGRVVSVLEGGYNINSGVVSSFAQSVFTHVKFLNIGLKKQEELEQKSKMKRKRDYLSDLSNYKRSKNQKLLENDILNNNYDSTNENENKNKATAGYVFRKRKNDKKADSNEIKDSKMNEDSFQVVDMGSFNDNNRKNSENSNYKNVLSNNNNFVDEERKANVLTGPVSSKPNINGDNNYNHQQIISNNTQDINVNIEEFFDKNVKEDNLICKEKLVLTNPDSIDTLRNTDIIDTNDKPSDNSNEPLISKINDTNDKPNNDANNDEEFLVEMNEEEGNR